MNKFLKEENFLMKCFPESFNHRTPEGPCVCICVCMHPHVCGCLKTSWQDRLAGRRGTSSITVYSESYLTLLFLVNYQELKLSKLLQRFSLLCILLKLHYSLRLGRYSDYGLWDRFLKASEFFDTHPIRDGCPWPLS